MPYECIVFFIFFLVSDSSAFQIKTIRTSALRGVQLMMMMVMMMTMLMILIISPVICTRRSKRLSILKTLSCLPNNWWHIANENDIRMNVCIFFIYLGCCLGSGHIMIEKKIFFFCFLINRLKTHKLYDQDNKLKTAYLCWCCCSNIFH